MKKIFEFETIADYLGAVFAARKQKNAGYSLRAFARDLNMSSSRVSEVLKGNHGLSEDSADQLAKKLRLSARETEFWKDLILSQSARSKSVRALAVARVQDQRKREHYRKIEEAQFRVMADWYHSAIVEAVQLPDVSKLKGSELTKNVGALIGISSTLVSEALERLQTLNILSRDGLGQWTSHPEAYGVFPTQPSWSIRKFHRQILEMHIQSLLNDPMEQREFFSMILAIPSNRLDELKKGMRQYVLDFWSGIENEPRDTLYSFSLQLCPVKNRTAD